MVCREVEAYAEREGIEVEFSRGEERDDGADYYTADCDVTDYAAVACGVFLGEALLWCEDLLLGRCHVGGGFWQERFGVEVCACVEGQVDFISDVDGVR